MSQIDDTLFDGAFPGREYESRGWWPGVSKREWYAGLAMQGILANNEAMRQLMAKSQSGNLDRSTIECVADRSFMYADAMIAASEKEAS